MESDAQTPTRKERREQARVLRRRLERAEAAKSTKRRRVKLLAIASGLVLAGCALVLITSAGAAKKVAPGTSQARHVSAEVSSLLRGIPQQGDALGQIGAPVTLQYFGDLECPVCRSFTVEALPSIIRNDVRSGRLRIEYHALETATREPEVFADQQIAALAAGTQQKLWNFVETFYHEQGEEDSGYVNERFIQGIAEQLPGLNLARWKADRAGARLAGELEDDAQAASTENFSGTPAFLLGRTGGSLHHFDPSSIIEPASFEQAVSRLAESAAPSHS